MGLQLRKKYIFLTKIYDNSYMKGGKMLQLKDILKNANITQMEIATALNIKSLSTVHQKLNNKSEFTMNEAILLRNLIKKRTNKKYSIEELFQEN